MKTLLALLGSLVLVTSTAHASDEPFMSAIPLEAKTLFTQYLVDGLPTYIEATDAVLAEIAALPEGTVNDATELDEIPIPDLFDKAAIVQKSPAWYDVDFQGGRVEEDIAWLKKSRVELAVLVELAKRSLAGEDVDAQIDLFLDNTHIYSRHDTQFEIVATLAPVSRFYCNVEFDATKEKDATEATVQLYESCD